MSWRTLLAVSTPVRAGGGVADGGRELGVAVLRRDDQVGLDLALDRVAVRDAQAVCEDGDERHERDPDHQRGRGRGRAARVALRVAARRACPPRPPCAARGSRPTSDERPDEPRREHRDADEQREHADPEQGEPVADGDVVGERPVAEREHGERDDRRLAMYGVKCAKRPRGSVAPSRTAAIGGTRVARIAGKRPATQRHERPDEQRDDDRPRREDGRRSAAGRGSAP